MHQLIVGIFNPYATVVAPFSPSNAKNKYQPGRALHLSLIHAKPDICITKHALSSKCIHHNPNDHKLVHKEQCGLH